MQIEGANNKVHTDLPMIRLCINGVDVFEVHPPQNQSYAYVTSGLFPVKVGDTVNMQTVTCDDNILYGYSLS